MPHTKRKNSLSASSKEITSLKKELRKINKKLGFGSSKLRFGNDEEDEMRAKLLSTGEVELEDIQDLGIDELQQLTEALNLSLREEQTAEQTDANEMLTAEHSIVSGLSMEDLLSLDAEEFDLLYAVHSINRDEYENLQFRPINYTPLFREYTRSARMEHLNQFKRRRGMWPYRTPAPWTNWETNTDRQRRIAEQQAAREASAAEEQRLRRIAERQAERETNTDRDNIMNALRRSEHLLEVVIQDLYASEDERDQIQEQFNQNQDDLPSRARNSPSARRIRDQLFAQSRQLYMLDEEIEMQRVRVEMAQREFNRLRRAVDVVIPPQDTIEQIQDRLLQNGIEADVTEGFNLGELKELEFSIIETRGCTNLTEWEDGQMVDTISLESPDINNDRVTIIGTEIGRGGREKEDEESSMQVVCLDRQFLLRSMGQRMARWVQNPNTFPMNEMGIGGMADQNVLYFGPLSIISGIAGFLDDPSFTILEQMTPGQNPIFRLEKTIDEERIGNLDSEPGVSRHHGQLPGFPIYKLVRMR